MVHTSSLYCPEQITIPENFPEILKNYAKAALRTQPYDLLKWSATYFRCLQMGIPPPVKSRYERNAKHGSVTKEYLRVLIKQVGKGFFISRSLLFQRWEGLCLPQDELLKYLSLCRMLHWPQIHWLKLLAVIIGFMNQNPMDTMIMLCELLTDNLEGAESYIPMWMFRICYTFLAELDCSEEQKFIDGRKLLSNGELEDEIKMKAIPEISSSASLRKAVLEECRNRYTGRLNDEKANLEKQKNDVNNDSISTSRESRIFEMLRNDWETKQINDRCGDFDSIILLLREAQGAKLHEYDGPVRISYNQIRKAKNKENKINEEREKQSNLYEENIKQEIFEQQMKMMKEIGPPWTWLHEFTTENHCLDKSYNFIEISESIPSTDITPALSSDESFDFDKEKPIADITSEESSDDAVTVISKKESSILSEDLENLLLKNENEIKQEIEDEKKSTLLEPCFEHLRSTLMNIEFDKDEKGNLKKTESVITYLRKEAAEILEKAGEKAKQKIDLLEIAKILEQAYENGIIFENLDAMIDYIRKLYPELENEKSISCETPHVDLTNVTNEVVEEECKTKNIKILGEEITMKEEEKKDENITLGENRDLEISGKIPEKDQKNIDLKSDFKKTEEIEEKSMKRQSSDLEIETLVEKDEKDTNNKLEDKSAKIDEVNAEMIQITDKNVINDKESAKYDAEENVSKDKLEKSNENMVKIFEANQIDVDKKLVDEIISEHLIDGLEENTENLSCPEEDSVEEPEESELTTTTSELSMMGNICDDSSLEPSTVVSTSRTVEEEEMKSEPCTSTENIRRSPKIKIRPNAFECTIPPVPGIGKAVSKKTIQDFLTYLKGRSLIQNGMVCPRNFKEPNCPNMIDYDN